IACNALVEVSRAAGCALGPLAGRADRGSRWSSRAWACVPVCICPKRARSMTLHCVGMTLKSIDEDRLFRASRARNDEFPSRLQGLLARSGLSRRALSAAMGRDPGYVAALLDPGRPSRSRPTPENLLR